MNRARELVDTMESTCTGFPCELILNCALKMSQQESDIARLCRDKSALFQNIKTLEQKIAVLEQSARN